MPTPAPEAIDGGDWVIQPSYSPRVAGVTANEGPGGMMIVPVGADRTQRAVRNHEMLHVSITPRGAMGALMAEIDPTVLNLVEDSRVHGRMRVLDLDPMSLDVIDPQELLDTCLNAPPAVIVAMAAATVGTGEFYKLDDAARSCGREDAPALFDIGAQYGARMHACDGGFAPWERTVQIAREILDRFGDPRQAPEPGSRESQVEGSLQEMNRHEGMPTNSDEAGEWGKLRIINHPLVLTLPPRMRGIRRRTLDRRGRRLHRVGRLAADGRVFADRPPLKGGGAVLIDVSGSMHLEPGAVTEVMSRLPAGVIGSYHGHGEQGKLYVLARDGRRVHDDNIVTGEWNCVDGPALEWLAAQRGPRYWVSDGKINGAHGSHAPNLFGDVRNVCRRARIVRVSTMGQLQTQLTQDGRV